MYIYINYLPIIEIRVNASLLIEPIEYMAYEINSKNLNNNPLVLIVDIFACNFMYNKINCIQ